MLRTRLIPITIAIFSIFAAILLIAPNISYACNEGVKHNADEPCSNSDTTAGGAIIIINGVICFSDGQPRDIFDQFVGGWRMPRDGTIQNMRIAIGRNTADVTVSVTLHVDGTATSLRTDIVSGSTANIDITGTVDVFDGEKISIIGDSNSNCNGVVDITVSYGIQ